MNFGPILSSFKTAIAGVSLASIYFDRAQQPDAYAGFPYLEVFLSVVSEEVAANQGTISDGTNLTTYELAVKVYSVQDQTGGATSGDAITDASNLLNALEAIMNAIPIDTTWNTVEGFLHSIPVRPAKISKHPILFDGRDVYVGERSWHLLIGE